MYLHGAEAHAGGEADDDAVVIADELGVLGAVDAGEAAQPAVVGGGLAVPGDAQDLQDITADV